MTGPDKNGSKKTGPENRFCDFTKTKLRFGCSDTSCLLTCLAFTKALYFYSFKALF